jgi:tetratricopeptide (TPR) repeat protein
MLRGTAIFFLFFVQSLLAVGQNTLIRTSDDESFRTGLELMDNAKYSAAREFFQRYVNLNKNDLRTVDAEYYIAYCAMNLFHSDAEALLENFTEKYPYHSKSSYAFYDLGTLHFNNKKYEKAIQYFEKVNTLDLSESQKLEFNFKLAYSYFSQKDFEKAEPLFNYTKAFENKYSYASSYYAGYLEFKNGSYEAALADLKKAEQNEAYKPLVPVMIANIYYRQEDYDNLAAYSEKVLNNPDYKNIQGKDEIFLLTADSYFKKKDYSKSAEYFKKYTGEQKSKTSPEIKYRLAYSEYRINDFDSAIKNFSDIAGNQDSIAQSAAYYLGLSYLKKGNKPFALSAFDLSRKTSFSMETKEEASFNYGKLNVDLQRFHDAISSLKDFSKEFPKSEHNGEVQELLSESFLSTNNYSEAISYIESLKVKSLRINTAYQRVTFYSGVQQFNNKKFDEAIRLFDKSIELPIDKDVFLAANFWKGEAYSLNKDYNNAITSYSTVFQKTQDNNEYHLKSRYGIGYAYFNTKQYDKAFPHFKNYVEKLRNASDKQFYDDALLRLADLYYQSKKYDDAIKYYNEAVTGKIIDRDYAYYQRGVVYGILDKLTEAKSSLDVVILNYPQSLYHDDAIFEKAQLNSQAGNYPEAIDGFSKIVQQKTGSPYVPYALVKRGVAYTNLKRNEEAIKDYETILTDYASHSVAEDAFLGLQELYEKTDRSEEFKKWIDVMEKANPKNTSLVTAKFNDAKNLYFAEKYKQAIESFTSYLNTYPGSPNVNEVNYYLADSYQRTGDLSNALKYHNMVIVEKDPVYYVRSIQRVAEIQFNNGFYAEAKNYYNLLVINARSKKDKLNGWKGLMEAHYKTATYDSVIVYANEIKNHGQASIDAESNASLYLGKSYYAKQNFDKAIDYFINTVNLAKDAYGAEAQYLIAEIQYKQKKHKQSLETLYQLNNIFSEFNDWISRSFLLIADNYIAMDEIFQAKATLNSIIENSPHQESVENARLKLVELERKEGGSNE